MIGEESRLNSLE